MELQTPGSATAFRIGCDPNLKSGRDEFCRIGPAAGLLGWSAVSTLGHADSEWLLVSRLKQ